MTRIVYIIAQGHTGSTLLDCILGTHPQIVSSGEMRYLNYQIDRTRHKIGTVKDQDICTCLRNFSDCDYWKAVANDLEKKVGIDILERPRDFDRAFFGEYSYRQRGGHKVSKLDRSRKKIIKSMLFRQCSREEILDIEPRISHWVENELKLCQSMLKVQDKTVIVDSSKDITKALLMAKFFPESTTIIFIHREARGLTASIKRRQKKRKRGYLALIYTILAKYKYELMVARCKKINSLKWDDVNYEDFVGSPREFLTEFSEKMGLTKNDFLQSNGDFFIEPNKLHIVAGNPMRYRGRQKVVYDNRWSSELNKIEMFILGFFFKERS